MIILRQSKWPLRALLPSIFFLLVSLAHGASPQHRILVLLTLDGVRTQEFCKGVDPTLTQKESGELFTFITNSLDVSGKRWGCDGTDVKISNPYAVSLPGYASIFTGSITTCADNNCPRVSLTTFPQRLTQEGGYRKHEIVTFASWNKICLAVESSEGSTFIDSGPNKDSCHSPYDEVRPDEVTMQRALERLDSDPPAFMYISLNDSDDLAHQGRYDELVQKLRTYDGWIGSIIKRLERLEATGTETALIVTTDHGRGATSEWRNHGKEIFGSENIWLYAWSPVHSPWERHAIRPSRPITHLDIARAVLSFHDVAPEPCRPCKTLVSWIDREQVGF